MSFTTGLGHPTMLSRTNYYINNQNPGTPINNWNANTYLLLSFDASGSMDDIMPVIRDVVDCAYCASGTAAGGDCVQATNCLRVDLQDKYATGGIEGAPDYNSNTATNGKDAYEAHVAYRVLGNEQFLTWFQNYYPARDISDFNAAFANHLTWEAFGNANTVDNLMFITVGNEAGPSGGSQNYNERYHRNLFGGPITVTRTATVNGATSNSTTFTSDDTYGNGGGEENEKLTGAGALGHATYADVIGTGSNNAFRMFLTGRSSGDPINSNAYITAISNGSANVTLSAAHSFFDDEVLTFTLYNPGIDMTATPMPDYKIDVRQMRESITFGTNVDYSDGLHGSGFAPGKGLSGLKAGSGQEPSIHWAHIDPGAGSALTMRITNGVVADAPQGPKANNGNAPGTNYTGPQRHAIEGTLQGIGIYGNDSGTNHSLNDWNTVISSWNGKSNTFSVIPLLDASDNTSQAFWYNEIKQAIQIGMNI